MRKFRQAVRANTIQFFSQLSFKRPTDPRRNRVVSRPGSFIKRTRSRMRGSLHRLGLAPEKVVDLVTVKEIRATADRAK